MNNLLVLLTGIILAVMISINGNLTNVHGVYLAAVIIHIVGSVFALILCMLQKDKKPLFSEKPKWIYLGGAIGVITTIFNNMAYGHISMTSIIALGLLGQAITSLIIDCYGLLGMKKQTFKKHSLIGFTIAFMGIFLMMDKTVTSSMTALIVSLIAGVSIVLSRTVNARLAERIGALRGSLVNHLVGLPITVVVLLIAVGGHNFTMTAGTGGFQPWIYLGGTLGVTVVLLYNYTVPKVPAFSVTLLCFLGQVFTGILIDFMSGAFSFNGSFLGGIVISLGMVVNIILDKVLVDKESNCPAVSADN